ncbi:PucR family transcriptional regulator [Nocardia uniformis]|uniref:PucR family transcriptional regulator n=1 Tax=Nocardia uniformis TaxID=53432 RepID=A0A849C8V4_9NOCA|nr:helix-turn-helix domain-containing protein [Nocardia uniformis]NNH71289.1 PucR family transcriptional regulator [Nocardia uniformis]
MTSIPRASLGRILDDLGSTLLHLVCGSVHDAEEISDVVIYDPHDEPVLTPHALVLGVGLRDGAEFRRVLDDLGERGAAGLIVRAPVTADPALHDITRRRGIALLGLVNGASWNQLAALLRALLAGDVDETNPETLGGIPSGDLFAVANAVSALLDAPVTIEDRSCRVLAFSGGQDLADPSRTETILQRQVPDRHTASLEAQGVFRELYRSTAPIRIEPPADLDDFAIPRVAQAVRAGDEMLGSIWAATAAPLTPELILSFQESAKLVALHLVRRRAGADIARRLRADLVSRALDGGPGAVEAVRKLGLLNRTVTVLAMTSGDPADPPSVAAHGKLAAERERLTDALTIHLTAAFPTAAAALLGDVAYAIVPLPDPAADDRAAQVADDFLQRIGDRVRLSIGAGTVTQDVAGLGHSRAAADRALRVALTNTASGRVVRIADVQAEALLLELRDLMRVRGETPAGPIARLLKYDAAQGSSLVDSLRAWLDAFGDVTAAAAAVYIHPNTFRYRLRRIEEIGRIDLTDPDARFTAMLQLRLIAPENSPDDSIG